MKVQRRRSIKSTDLAIVFNELRLTTAAAFHLRIIFYFLLLIISSSVDRMRA